VIDIPLDNAGWAALIGDALTALPGFFPVGALAYITATSKAENPVRDAIAFFIHERVRTAGYAVAREWLKRRDLAVLDQGGAAAVQLEAKALYGFDVLSCRRRASFLTGMKFGHGKDVVSLRPAVADGQACFLLSLVTHPMAPIPSGLLQVIKYG
jgi:hypothetical protein